MPIMTDAYAPQRSLPRPSGRRPTSKTRRHCCKARPPCRSHRSTTRATKADSFSPPRRRYSPISARATPRSSRWTIPPTPRRSLRRHASTATGSCRRSRRTALTTRRSSRTSSPASAPISRAAVALTRAVMEYAALADKTESAIGQEFADFPLARIEADRPLPLTQGYNPAWADKIAQLRTQVVEPLFGQGKTNLSDAEWGTIKATFAAHEAWRGKKAGATAEKLGLARVRELLSGDAKTRIAGLIAEDKALEPEMNAIVAVERLVRYHRDLYTLLNNFVNFRDFYSRVKKSVFQAGTLYLDSRACELCVRVADPAKHGVLASFSSAYLVYLDCTRRGSTEKMSSAAAITDGDADHLMVGRNAVFYDRQGQDWDATIVKIIENPISIRQAIWAPYKRVGRMIGEQIEKMAAAKDKAVSSRAAAGVESTAAQAEAGKPAAPAPIDVAKFAGIIAALGLAIGALGTALAAIVTGFFSLSWWQIPLAILGVMLVISGPSVVIAWLKLRRRNLAPILDANGWAVNARVKINSPFGRTLTQLAVLPPGARRSLDDPYATEGGSKWIWIALLIVALATGGYYYYATHHAPAAETTGTVQTQ